MGPAGLSSALAAEMDAAPTAPQDHAKSVLVGNAAVAVAADREHMKQKGLVHSIPHAMFASAALTLPEGGSFGFVGGYRAVNH